MVRIAPVVGLMAAGAIAAPTSVKLGSGSSCTSVAQNDFKWGVTHLNYNASIIFTTAAHQNDNAVIQFTLINPAFPEAPSTCVGYSSRADGFFYNDVVYKCTSNDADQSTIFVYNAPTKSLSVNQTFSCADENSSFNYLGEVDLSDKMTCSNTVSKNTDWKMGEDFSRNITECAGPAFSWTPETSSGVAKL